MSRLSRLAWTPLLFGLGLFAPLALPSFAASDAPATPPVKATTNSVAQAISALQNAAESPWRSPNGRFELYTKTVIFDAENDVMEQALFCRRAGDDDPGVGLHQYKFFEVHWSADSKYVAISGHFLDHNADFFLYRVSATGAGAFRLELLRQFREKEHPVEWTFQDWRAHEKKVLVKRAEVADSAPDKNADKADPADTTSILEVALGGTPLKTIRYSVDESAESPATSPASRSGTERPKTK